MRLSARVADKPAQCQCYGKNGDPVAPPQG